MGEYRQPIRRYRGHPREISFAAGHAFGEELERKIHHYIASRRPSTDMGALRQGALPWLKQLPRRFQGELEGIAEGANLSLQRLAEWAYAEECPSHRCSAAVCRIGDRAWVARNNGYLVPDVWGYVTIREVEGRIPAINFGMEGDVFTATGINRDKLWLHYHDLPAWDQPAPGKAHWPAYVVLTEALEVCGSIRDVEALLGEVHRDGGLLLFAVDGKSEAAALFECTCRDHFKHELEGEWTVGTNHCGVYRDPALAAQGHSPNTVSRFRRMECLVHALYASPTVPHLPADLVRILADPGVEQCGAESGTVYASVACPGRGELWYTFGGYPAGSRGDWQQLEWPWPD